MKQALEGATDEDRAAVQEMLSDLNDLLEKHQQSDGSPESRAEVDRAFEQFMAKHGDWFPENPATVDEARRRPRPAGRGGPADAGVDDTGAAGRASRSLSQQAFGSPGLVEQARPDGRQPAVAAPG